METGLRMRFLTLLACLRNARPSAGELTRVLGDPPRSAGLTSARFVLAHPSALLTKCCSASSSPVFHTSCFVFYKIIQQLQEELFAYLQPGLSLFIELFTSTKADGQERNARGSASAPSCF